MEPTTPVPVCGACLDPRRAAAVLAALRVATDGAGPFAVELHQDDAAAGLRIDVHFDRAARRPRPDAARIVAAHLGADDAAALAVRWVEVRAEEPAERG